ncbi:alpha/beta hydrolase [Zhengella mangrovi]|uniref:Alpha/beta hydrolase n=1 Tax=Zhengella mangrovi TaxID=1982044 RepID=A0A2G1QKC2_9HYPH|nr:alpha/beta hydrolase [Zhengella mangrovi]PHP65900.1 alpha/beta hydrolase [Zhengella mangrovi]
MSQAKVPPMLDPELKPFLDTWTKSWAVLPENATPKERRLLFEYIAEKMRLPAPAGITLDTRFVPSEGRNVLVRIERHGDGGTQPCLVYMHGGAWMQGSPMTHADITSRIAAANRQTVVSIDYALAPEHVFPKAVHEVMDVVRWVRTHAADLGIDPARIAIGGDSAGANLAAAACIGLRGSADLPMAQLLVYPCVHFEMSFPSYVENANAPLLQVAGMPRVNAMYCPDKTKWTDPLVAPLHAASHAGLPQAFIAVAENDPLRDDGYAYADRLREAGVSVEFDPGKGLIHGYLRAMEHCTASREKLKRMGDWLAACYAAGVGSHA